jgi:hypothetical protein
MAEKDTTISNGHGHGHGHDHDELDTSTGVYVVKQNATTTASDDEAGVKSPTGHLKTTSDGATVLIPQPSDDPNDPLNWSWLKKHAVFLSLLPGCFLTDWVITWGTTLVGLQDHSCVILLLLTTT